MGSRQSSEPSGSPAGRANRAGPANSRLLNLAAAAEQGAALSSNSKHRHVATLAIMSVTPVCLDGCVPHLLDDGQSLPPVKYTMQSTSGTSLCAPWQYNIPYRST